VPCQTETLSSSVFTPPSRPARRGRGGATTATIRRPRELVIGLDDEGLYRALRDIADARDRTMDEIGNEALRQWLQRQEDEEDLAAIAAVEDEPTHGWDRVKAEMRVARTASNAG